MQIKHHLPSVPARCLGLGLGWAGLGWAGLGWAMRDRAGWSWVWLGGMGWGTQWGGLSDGGSPEPVGGGNIVRHHPSANSPIAAKFLLKNVFLPFESFERGCCHNRLLLDSADVRTAAETVEFRESCVQKTDF